MSGVLESRLQLHILLFDMFLVTVILRLHSLYHYIIVTRLQVLSTRGGLENIMLIA